MSGLVPRCFRLVQQTGAYAPEPSEAKFNKDGLCDLTLPAGTYRFEVLAAQQKENQITALRTDAVEVGANHTRADLPRAVRCYAHLVVDGTTMELRQVAVRSIGRSGEARWQATGKKPGSLVVIAATEGQTLQLALVGTSDRVSTAIWQRVTAGTSIDVKVQSQAYPVCEMVVDPQSPRIQGGTGRMTFPDSVVEFPYRPGHRFVINRKAAFFGYELVAEGGRTLVVEPGPVALTPRTTLTVGGRLQAKPWAFALWRDDGSFFTRWEAGLMDARGRTVNLDASKLDLVATIRGRDGSTPPEDKMDQPQIDAWSKPEETLLCDVKWTWDHEQHFTGPPDRLMEVKSEHFSVNVPEAWRQRGENYLAKLERTQAAYVVVCGRNRPRWTTIGWRENTHNAKAQVGGDTPWMSMPFQGLREAVSPYWNPWFMTHEMGHTFGYNHGAEMDAEIDAVNSESDSRCWAEVDAFIE